MARPIRVLIVDDSALIRRLLREMLSADPDIDVVGHAADAYIARDKIKQLNPDVITLDVEMPRMDGISFLRNLMRLRPMPVVMVSSMTTRGAEVTLEALDLGAVDYVAKPSEDIAESFFDYAEEIVTKVKIAAEARVRSIEPSLNQKPMPVEGVSARPACVIGVGASTGGTEAIRELLSNLPDNLPGILIVQHIPRLFASAFADRLDRNSPLKVKLAASGESILPGHAYVAPGDEHLTVAEGAGGNVCQLNSKPKINQHRPSVDVLFESLASVVGSAAVGVLLTGMGADGARGLAQLHSAGAGTIAQDESSSVVWGMPREAIELGAAQQVLPITSIGRGIVEQLGNR